MDLTRPIHAGKVRDLYAIDDRHLLMVASDRISAYDFALTPAIPDKGELLTRMSLWWFDQLADLVPNHLAPPDLAAVPEEVRSRALVCERLDMFPVECVARGYLAGSGLIDYQRTGAVCGVELPAGLVEGSRLAAPVFTPATKAEMGGHDENVDFDSVVATIGMDAADHLRSLTLAVYARAETLARDRGIIVADTKLEFGQRSDGTVVLADEVLTPDSSRFWPLAQWQPGRSQPSFDKQYVRDWLTKESGWDKTSGQPPPELPPHVVEQTRATYVSAFELLTGERF